MFWANMILNQMFSAEATIYYVKLDHFITVSCAKQDLAEC